MPRAAIPYEIHITIDSLERADEDALQSLCARHGARLLLIELARGAYTSQPMFSKVIPAADFKSALAEAQEYVRQLQAGSYRVSRLKIEVPATNASEMPADDLQIVPYFEWHGRIAYCFPDELLSFCEQHKVHLSRNALRDETATRFLTLREYGGQALFEERLTKLKAQLHHCPWQLQKEQSEYCVYDDNILLDQGWLP